MCCLLGCKEEREKIKILSKQSTNYDFVVTTKERQRSNPLNAFDIQVGRADPTEWSLQQSLLPFRRETKGNGTGPSVDR